MLLAHSQTGARSIRLHQPVQRAPRDRIVAVTREEGSGIPGRECHVIRGVRYGPRSDFREASVLGSQVEVALEWRVRRAARRRPSRHGRLARKKLLLLQIADEENERRAENLNAVLDAKHLAEAALQDAITACARRRCAFGSLQRPAQRTREGARASRPFAARRSGLFLAPGRRCARAYDSVARSCRRRIGVTGVCARWLTRRHL